VLDEDYRDDDLELLRTAIEMLRGVADVRFGEVVNYKDWIARRAVKTELHHELIKAIDNVFEDKVRDL
jgi:hypothetical protein